MKKTFLALAMIGAMAFSMTVYGGESETVDNAKSAETAADVGDVGEAPDYSIVIDEKTGLTEIRDINGDAQVNLARGTVITNADAVPNDMHDYTGPQSYHQDDYSIFYNNIKDNVAKRIAAYQAKK